MTWPHTIAAKSLISTVKLCWKRILEKWGMARLLGFAHILGSLFLCQVLPGNGFTLCFIRFPNFLWLLTIILEKTSAFLPLESVVLIIRKWLHFPLRGLLRFNDTCTFNSKELVVLYHHPFVTILGMISRKYCSIKHLNYKSCLFIVRKLAPCNSCTTLEWSHFAGGLWFHCYNHTIWRSWVSIEHTYTYILGYTIKMSGSE